ncbi:MAG: TRAP transporter small permease subunit [Aquamicrobium sp.]|jgi:TRAP-type mannitol/chloroaromatic compound transport system permease small subunit|uniref:TRAP transporter small permease subunit n=1 Tax=Neoaquamicrobium sediminum TaxID=1849104 RepID=UPI0029DF9C82|nr:TRAP transporter small permease subunit [Rhizobium sp.]MBX9463880.1 TRAP transporter small permease subunit [Aquamicrobium sp.]
MLNTIINLLERLITGIGRVVALFVLAIIAIMIYEMFSRAVLGRSVRWAGDASTWLLVAFIFLGGPWAMAKGNFVRVDAVYEHFSPLAKAIVDTVVSTALFALFIWVLLSFGYDFALKSFAMGERSATGGWGGPVWLPKAMLPIGAALLVLAWILNLLRGWRDALYAEEGVR